MAISPECFVCFRWDLQNWKEQSFNWTIGTEGITQLLKSKFERSKCKWRHQCHAFAKKETFFLNMANNHNLMFCVTELPCNDKFILDVVLLSLLNCVPYILKTCSRAVRAYVLTCLACLRVHEPTGLRVHVPTCLTCSHANVPCVLKCSRALRAYVLMCQRVLRAYVLTCQRVLRAYALACQRALHTHVLMPLTCPRANVPSVTRIHKRHISSVTRIHI